MAIIPKDNYPAQIDTTDSAGYPHGKAKNVATPGDGSGTPYEKAILNDWFGFQQAAMQSAAVTPSGTSDKVGASQVLDAAVAIARRDLMVSNWALQTPAGGGSPTLSALADADGLGVIAMVGSGGLIQTSPNGRDWTAQTPAGAYSGAFNGLVWGSWPATDYLVAVGASGEIQYSNNGTSWTKASGLTPAYAGTFWGVAFNPAGLYVAVGSAGGIYRAVATDMPTWYAATPAGGYSDVFYAVAWSPELALFVAVGENGEIQTSPDGATWTARTAAGGYSDAFFGIAWSPFLGLFVAVGENGEIQMSPDGATWTARTADGSYSSYLRAAAWSADLGIFIIVGNDGEIQTSPDGVTWTARLSAEAEHLFGALYSSRVRLFLASGFNGTLQTSLRM